LDPVDLALLQIVGRVGVITADQLSDYFLRSNAEDVYGHRVRSANIPARVQRLIVNGYLEGRPVVHAVSHATPGDGRAVAVAVGRVAYDRAFSVTKKASREFAMALPANVQESHLAHAIKTNDAVNRFASQVREDGGRVVDVRSESQLIPESYRGRVFDRSTGEVNVKFPDALVTVQHPDGQLEDVSIEYVSGKYTDEQIREKHSDFKGRVVWAASTPATAARVASITGQDPLLV